MEAGKNVTPAALMSLPEIGIVFQAFYVKQYIRYVAFWQDRHDEIKRHVYELMVEPALSPGLWRARAYVDNKILFSMSASSKWWASRIGGAAFKSYLLRTHRAAVRTARKSAAAGRR